MGLSVDFTNDKNKFSLHTSAKLNYSSVEFENCLSIIPHTILFEYGIKDYEIEVHSHPLFSHLFFKNSGSLIPFDLFGAAFWLITRYEEYLPHKTDSFNRFHYNTSVAYQYSFIDFPLVNHWLNELSVLIKKNFQEINLKKRDYNFISTIDIDNAYKYKYKGFVRSLAGYISDLKSGKLKNVKARTQILFSNKTDPFDSYEFLLQKNSEYNIKSIYFFLLGDYGKNDKNHSANNINFQSLIKHIADYALIGIHPSFGSTNKLQQLKIEVSRLAGITHKQITKSRQHFSILKFPDTYRSLIQSGLTDDFSMGYTNINGFRASYCYPFKWYSLEDEFSTSLIIHPFCISANTLDYLEIKENKLFMDSANLMIKRVKEFGGELIAIFHNDAFTQKMKENYTQFLKSAKS